MWSKHWQLVLLQTLLNDSKTPIEGRDVKPVKVQSSPVSDQLTLPFPVWSSVVDLLVELVTVYLVSTSRTDHTTSPIDTVPHTGPRLRPFGQRRVVQRHCTTVLRSLVYDKPLNSLHLSDSRNSFWQSSGVTTSATRHPVLRIPNNSSMVKSSRPMFHPMVLSLYLYSLFCPLSLVSSVFGPCSDLVCSSSCSIFSTVVI